MTSGYYDITNKVLGKGHHGLVKLARHCLSGEPTALKVIEKARLNPYSLQQLGTEIRILFTLSEYEHPNILKLYQTIDTSDKLFLVTEYCGPNACDLHDFLLCKRDGISETEARVFFIQICSAISYCHSMEIVHRDLKPENILVADIKQMCYKQKYPLLKLIDFGFANQWRPDEQMRTSCGTLAYSAPELLLGEPYDGTKVDVWGLGVLLYILIYGCNPFMQINDSETLTKILECSFVIPITNTSEQAIQLVRSLIKRNPKSRLSINEILKHRWLDQVDDQLPNNNNSLCIQSSVELISKNSKMNSLIHTPPLPSINEYGPLKESSHIQNGIGDMKLANNWRTRSLSITKNSFKENSNLIQTRSSINLSSDYDSPKSETTSLKIRTNLGTPRINHYRPTSPDIRGSILTGEELRLHNKVIDEMFRLTELINSKKIIESSLKSARSKHRKFNEKSIERAKHIDKSDTKRSNLLKTLQYGLKHQIGGDDRNLSELNICPIKSKLNNDDYIYATYQLIRDRIIRVKSELPPDCRISIEILPTTDASTETKTWLTKKLLQPQHKLKDRFTSFFRSSSKFSDGTNEDEESTQKAASSDSHHEAFSDHNIEHSAAKNLQNKRETLDKLSMSFALPLARKCSLVNEEGGYTSDLAE